MGRKSEVWCKADFDKIESLAEERKVSLIQLSTMVLGRGQTYISHMKTVKSEAHHGMMTEKDLEKLAFFFGVNKELLIIDDSPMENKASINLNSLEPVLAAFKYMSDQNEKKMSEMMSIIKAQHEEFEVLCNKMNVMNTNLLKIKNDLNVFMQDKKPEVVKARELIEEMLSVSGSLYVDALYKEASDRDISKTAIDAVKKEMNLIVSVTGYGSKQKKVWSR